MINVFAAALEASEKEVQQLSMALVQMGEDRQLMKFSDNEDGGKSIFIEQEQRLSSSQISDIEVNNIVFIKIDWLQLNINLLALFQNTNNNNNNNNNTNNDPNYVFFAVENIGSWKCCSVSR